MNKKAKEKSSVKSIESRKSQDYDKKQQAMQKALQECYMVEAEIEINRKINKALLIAKALEENRKQGNIRKKLSDEYDTGLEVLLELSQKKIKLYQQYQSHLQAYQELISGIVHLSGDDQSEPHDFTDCLESATKKFDLLRRSYNSYAIGANPHAPWWYTDIQPTIESASTANPSPDFNITVTGYNGNSNGQIWWGVKVDDILCGVKINCKSQVSGIVDIAWDNSSLVQTGLEIQVRQYRGRSEQVTEYHPTWTPYRTWHAFPELGCLGDSMQTVTHDTPGTHAMDPHRASLDVITTDVMNGDIFTFWYHWRVWAYPGGVDTSHNGKGALVVNAPVFSQFSRNVK